jgi:hypothetical protein
MRHFSYRSRGRSWRGVSPHNIGTTVFVVALAACAGYANLPTGAGGGASDATAPSPAA